MFLVNFYLQQFAEEFFTQENFPYQDTITRWKDEKVQVGSTT
jgi:hypothetical protein